MAPHQPTNRSAGGTLLAGVGTWTGERPGASPALAHKSSHHSLRRKLSLLSLSSSQSEASRSDAGSAGGKSSGSRSSILALQKIPSALFKSLARGGKTRLSVVPASDAAQSEAPAWRPPSPQYTAPETRKEVQTFIDEVASDCQNRRLGDRFNHWLDIERRDGKTDKQIAHALWNVAYIIDQVRQESAEYGSLRQLDDWLASEAGSKLDVELAADLIHAKDRIERALAFAREHDQQHVVEAFLDDARQQGKPDVVLIADLSPEGVPPWRPPVPAPAAPSTEADIRAMFDATGNASRYRGLGEKYNNWIQVQKLSRQTPAQAAHALWSAAQTILRARAESAANGSGEQLHQWLVSEATTKLDVELAAALADGKEKLHAARLVARQNLREDVFLRFIDAARREGKPDVVIVAELLQRGAPPWMPAWVPPVPQAVAPANAAQARALIERTEAACENRWLDSQFKDWVRVQKLNGKSEGQIARALWEAAHVIRETREESKANGTLRQLDQWLVAQASTRIDVELAANLAGAKVQLRNAHELARTAGREDAFLAFVNKARRQKKPDVVIIEAWTETQNPVARNVRQAEELKATHRKAFEQHLKDMEEAGPSDAHALPSRWAPPAAAQEVPTTYEDVRDTIQRASRAHADRWLDEEFDAWLVAQRTEKKNDAPIARALWEAAGVIHKTLEESRANGSLDRLDAWLASMAETKTDMELAAALAGATTGLGEARAAARRNGQEDVFQRFVDDARREAKPDVVILDEWAAGLA